MATIGATHVTMADFAKRFNPDQSLAVVAEVLTQSNPIIRNLPMVEANNVTSHRSTIRTGLTTAIWRKLYQGVQPTKGLAAQVDDAIGMLEDRAEIDCDLASLAGDAAAINEFRMGEAFPHLEGIAQQFASTLFYGDTDVNPERFTGLTPRYNSLSGANSQNVISGAGTGSDQTSIWLLCMNKKSLFGIYPKGSQMGLLHEDLGIQDAFDSQSPPARYRAYMDRFQLKGGVVVKDWRWCVRICNIDVTNMIGETTAPDLVKLMVKAMARIPTPNFEGMGWYFNRTVAEWLDIQSMGKATAATGIVTNVSFRDQDLAQGKMVQSFRGIPVYMNDALLNTEAQVV